MRKLSFVLLLLLFLILISCSQVSEKEILIVEEPVEEEKDELNTNLRPPLNDMQIVKEDNSSSDLIALVRSCWDEEGNSPCEANYDHAIEKVLEEKVLAVSPGESIQAFLYANYPQFEMPNLMEVFRIIGEDVNEKELEATGNGPMSIRFNVTEEEGLHYYLLRLEWNELISGEAYYVLKLLVR